MTRRRRFRLGTLCLALLIGPACDPPGVVDVVALTAWPPSQRLAFEQASRQSGTLDAIRWRWIEVRPVDQPGELLRKGSLADVVIGVPASVAHLLIDASDQRLVSRQHVGFVVSSDAGEISTWQSLATPALRGKLAIDDPRLDWQTFETMRMSLSPTEWSRGYGALVLAMGQAQRVGISHGATARVDRGEVWVAPGLGTEGPISDRTSFVPLQASGPWLDLAGLPKQGPRNDVAKRLLGQLEADALLQPGRVEPLSSSSTTIDFLLADLLGATLCEAQEELSLALGELDRMTNSERREELRRFLVEPPPWPPASIRKLIDKPDAETLLTILTGELTSDTVLREWLLVRWREPQRPIDQGLLTQLTQAEGGLLAREPRFRSWLRAEWTAWARQRYRRVARVASGAFQP